MCVSLIIGCDYPTGVDLSKILGGTEAGKK